jgi:hypothetical protein
MRKTYFALDLMIAASRVGVRKPTSNNIWSCPTIRRGAMVRMATQALHTQPDALASTNASLLQIRAHTGGADQWLAPVPFGRERFLSHPTKRGNSF